MKRINKLHLTNIMLGAIVVLLSACDGLFEDVYDNNKSTSSTEVKSGEFTVDATSYTQWHYVSIGTDSVSFYTAEIASDGTETGIPDKWDIALHRYDVKTNGCTAAETNFTSISDLQAALSEDPQLLASLDFKADSLTQKKIIIDMSGMMQGIIGYQESMYNARLSQWLNVDTSVMPPIYTMSHKVYVLSVPDGRYYALYLVNYMNEKSVKGHMTVQYVLLSD